MHGVKHTTHHAAKYCYKCGVALDLKTVMGWIKKRNDTVDELMELVTANPQILKVLRGLAAERAD